MSYEQAMGMGLLQTSQPCTVRGTRPGDVTIENGLRRCVRQIDLIDDESVTEGCVLMPLSEAACDDRGQEGEFYCCPPPAGYRTPTTATPSTSAGLTPSGLRPSPFDEGGEAAAPASGKQTWWTGDIEGMVSGFFSKLGIGERAAEEAEGAAREEAAAVTPGPTSISEVAPSAQTPRVQVEDTTPWYVQYAPHMVIGGLGLGAVVTLVLVMRKRG